MPQNLQDIQRSHKVYWENHDKLKSQTDSMRKKLSRGENPERNIPGIYVIIIIIGHSDDATQSLT